MKIIICDDADIDLNSLSNAAKNWATSRHLQDVVSERRFSSTEDLLETWQAGLAMDVLFLDIQIPGEMSGMQLAKTIRETDGHVLIVFVTHFAEYACEGYCVNALRYLQKPIHEETVFECLDIAYRQWQFAQAESIVLETKKQTFVLPYREIFFIEAYAHYLIIHRAGLPPMRIRGRIADISRMLPEEMFIRCHRGFVVNVCYIRSISKTRMTLVGNLSVPIGEKYMENAFRKFRQYHQGVLL